MADKDPNREVAEQRLAMGQDPGGAYSDLSKKYENQQLERKQPELDRQALEQAGKATSKSSSGCAAFLFVGLGAVLVLGTAGAKLIQSLL